MTFALIWSYGIFWSMNILSYLIRGRSSFFLMHVHLVFFKTYLRNIFIKQILDDLKKVFFSICTDFEAHLIELEGESDHIHLLVEYPPKVAVSKLVNSRP